MKIRTDVLVDRVKISLCLKAVLIVFLFVLLTLALHIPLQAEAADIRRIQIYSGALLLLLLASLAGDWWYIYLPYKKLCEREKQILCGKNIEEGLQLPYVYSTVGRNLEKELNRLYDRKGILDRSMQQSQYFALLNQINPHFLYNMLDAIRSDAMLAGETQIADMIEALSTYFSYTISNLDQLATLSEELEHVKNYFYIQKYRFGDRLNLAIMNQMYLDTQELFIPRLILQPIIENAICHGIGSRQKGGTVTIEIMQTQEHLIIDVIDDGVGMDEEALTQLNDRLQRPFEHESQERKKRGGIALSNVSSRIKLLFGDDCGVRICSVLGEGTTTRVMLPNVLRENINEKRILENR